MSFKAEKYFDPRWRVRIRRAARGWRFFVRENEDDSVLKEVDVFEWLFVRLWVRVCLSEGSNDADGTLTVRARAKGAACPT